MKRLALLFTIVLSALCTDCAQVQAWWQNFQNDPVAQVQAFENTTQLVLSNATTAWDVIKVFLPANIAVQAQLQFDNAVAAVTHAEQALQDAVQAYVDAKTSFPDFTKAILDVNNAVQQVIAIVNEYKTQQQPPPGAPKLAELPGYADMIKGASSMQHYVVKVH